MKPEEYRKLAATEDRMWYFRALHSRRAHWLARLLPAGPARVLDAGCGTGGFIRAVRGMHPDWTLTGIDVSPLACGLARERAGAEIVEGSLAALPFTDGSFDAVTTGDVLYHLEEPAMALREFARVLRPGGVVVVNEPAYRWLWSYHDDAVAAQHRFTRPELAAALRASGFDVRFASYANLLILPLVAARRKLFPSAAGESDVQVQAAPLEKVLGGIAALEQAWLGRGLASPAGSSVFLAGVKQ